MRHVLAMAAIGGCLVAGPARAEFTKSQELTILAAHSALLASQRCPYALDERRLGQVLARKNLSRADLASGQSSRLLREDLAADDRRYESDTAAACDQAWASFGPGAPMAGLLRRK